MADQSINVLQKLIEQSQKFNPLAFGLNLGGDLLGGLTSWLGGSGQRSRKKEVYNLAKNRMGMDVLHPDQYLAEYYRSMAPEFNKRAESVNSRLGLDSGVAQAEIGSSMESSLASFLLQAKQQNDVLKSQRNDQLLQLMAQVA